MRGLGNAQKPQEALYITAQVKETMRKAKEALGKQTKGNLRTNMDNVRHIGKNLTKTIEHIGKTIENP